MSGESATGGARAVRACLAVAVAGALAATGCGDAGGSGGGGGGGGGEKSGEFRRPVTMIVPFGPGVGSDQAGRVAAAVIEKEIGVQMPVINVPGATGNTGMTKLLQSRPSEAVAIMPADTLATVVAGSSSFKLDEIAAVCRISNAPSSLWVNTKGEYDSWKELSEAAKEQPGKIGVSTVGRGGIDDIMLGALEQEAGVKFRKVPFAEGGERKGAVLSGDTAAIFEQTGDVKENIEGGQFKRVLLFGSKKQEGEGLNDDYVLSSELGITEVVDQWRGVFASAEMPPEQVQTLSEACGKVEASEQYKNFRENAYEEAGGYMDRATYQDFVEKEQEKMQTLGKRYGVFK